MSEPLPHATVANAHESPPQGVIYRDLGHGLLGTAWPLFALSIMTVLLIRACVPIGVVPVMAAFDAATAARNNNERAMAAISTLQANAPSERVAQVLNQIVVNFASGSSELPSDARQVLTKAAERLGSLNGASRFEIGGHTDSTGSTQGNIKLSEQRARSVANFLVMRGAPADRFVVTGYGDGKPIADNGTERGRFGNRRIEFTPLP